MSETIELVDSNTTASTNTYDEVPYESHPYAQSAPVNLMTLGTLFGMNPAPIETARVLELGCASGGNLIPHAINFPKAKFLGVDLSKVQIDEGTNYIGSLGLKNIELRHCSITDIDESFGKFDYIICHGVISWVPEFVRKKIFEVCSKNLETNGIAYVSYNTLPGWNMIRTIRDMMLYHSSMFGDIKEKVAQSRLLLEFVKDSVADSGTPYSAILKQEAELLSKHSDYYLRHDHLEEENKQYYFNEFMDEAKQQGLQYLSDCSLSSMYVGNMPAKVSEKLKDVNDIVRTEQYMDFITNRRFRMTLLCHNNVKLNRSLNQDTVTNFNMVFNVFPEKPLAEIDINNSLESVKFFYNNNKDSSLSTSSTYMKAILYSFAERINNPISFEKLVTIADKKLGGNKAAEIKTEFLNNAMRLILQGYITITLSKGYDSVNLEAPEATKVARFQVMNTSKMFVTNLRHETVSINLLDKYTIRYMDGKNTKDQILELLIDNHITKNELNLNKDGRKIEDKEELRTELKAALDAAIEKAAVNALLVGK